MSEREELNKITEGIIGAAIEVHRHLEPGLLESAYKSALPMNLKDAVINWMQSRFVDQPQ
jgi:GxxExxY protein